MSFAFAPFVRALSALLPLLVVGSAHAATSNVGACRPGMTVTDDTAGHCCWAGQAWANRCVGKPSTCPEGMDVKGDACVPTPCPNGQERMTDRWHCCWVGQAWSKSRNQCIGTPDKCPAGTTVDAVSEQCIEKGASAVVQTEARAVPRPPVRPPPQNERTCAPGQAIGPDSDGHCCWPGQAWTDRCIGKPTACPDGWSARRDECVEVPCDSGMERASGHCCWPGQAWSKSRSVCVGTPARCPANTVVDADAELCRPALSPVAPPMPAVRASEGPKCPAGTAIAVDTDGHCCPAAFRWSAAGRVCTRRPDFDHATVEPASAPATPAPSAGLQQGTRGRPPPAKPPTSVGFDASDDTIAQTASTESSAEFEVLPHRVGLHLESLEERTERVDTANLFHLAFGYTGSFSSSGMQIGTTTLGWRHIDPTGFFPGAGGGSRSCFDFRLDFGLMGGATAKHGSYYPAFGGLAAMGLGYTWLNFSPRNGDSLRQGGFGIDLGVKVGAQYIKPDGQAMFSPIIAPNFGIEFPSWNPGTASFSAVSIDFLVIPPIAGSGVTIAFDLAFDM